MSEAIPRLAVRLRSAFPEAQIDLRSRFKMGLVLPQSQWDIEVDAVPIQDERLQSQGFQNFRTSLTLCLDCLQRIPELDFLHLIAAENEGLRGITLLAERSGPYRTIRLQTGFFGRKGRTHDESESLTLDVLSVIGFAHLLEDRIHRSKVGSDFCLEIYRSRYNQSLINRNRFINFARTIFRGSLEQSFNDMVSHLRLDGRYRVQVTGPHVAKVTTLSSTLEIVLRIPNEVPMLTCFAPLFSSATLHTEKAMDLVSRLNWTGEHGHFECNTDGSLISFASWKQLTNDIRFRSVERLLESALNAEQVLRKELPHVTPLPSHAQDEAAVETTHWKLVS